MVTHSAEQREHGDADACEPGIAAEERRTREEDPERTEERVIRMEAKPRQQQWREPHERPYPSESQVSARPCGIG